MARITGTFSSPLLLGFDHLERTLDRISRCSAEGYPPYNIEQIGDDRLRITLAVAGFCEDDLSVVLEGEQLTVSGRIAESGDEDRVFLHRGIATRQFQRSFLIAEGIEVTGASLDRGLLAIDLLRPQSQSRMREIPIARADAPAGAMTIGKTGK